MNLRSNKIIHPSQNNTNTNNTNNEKNNDRKKYINKNITCNGCIENQPNQLAHMDVGGCLEEKYLDLYAKPIIKIKRLEYEY
jgi:hypothetical protein